MTEPIDALGRRTNYTYAANGLDLLASYGAYTSGHLPQTIADAAGDTTTLTYTTSGQVATSTNAKNETPPIPTTVAASSRR